MFYDRVSACSFGWPKTHYVAQLGLKLSTSLLLHPLDCWHHRCVPLWLGLQGAAMSSSLQLGHGWGGMGVPTFLCWCQVLLLIEADQREAVAHAGQMVPAYRSVSPSNPLSSADALCPIRSLLLLLVAAGSRSLEASWRRGDLQRASSEPS